MPARLLRGQLPAALLAEYSFWRDADGASMRGAARADRPDATAPRTELRVTVSPAPSGATALVARRRERSEPAAAFDAPEAAEKVSSPAGTGGPGRGRFEGGASPSAAAPPPLPPRPGAAPAATAAAAAAGDDDDDDGFDLLIDLLLSLIHI